MRYHVPAPVCRPQMEEDEGMKSGKGSSPGNEGCLFHAGYHYVRLDSNNLHQLETKVLNQTPSAMMGNVAGSRFLLRVHLEARMR